MDEMPIKNDIFTHGKEEEKIISFLQQTKEHIPACVPRSNNRRFFIAHMEQIIMALEFPSELIMTDADFSYSVLSQVLLQQICASTWLFIEL